MDKNKDSSEFSAIARHCDAGRARFKAQRDNPDANTDLQGLSAYQNIQGARSARCVDSRARLG